VLLLLIVFLVNPRVKDCSLTDDNTLVTLARTLRLIIVVQDLAAANRSLRDDWKPKHTTILTLRNVVTVRLGKFVAMSASAFETYP
jgi:predicted nuclease of predicted toxin-antitoxin system